MKVKSGSVFFSVVALILSSSNSNACCGLGGGLGSNFLFVLIGAAVIVWTSHFLYLKTVGIRGGFLKISASGFIFVFGAFITINLSSAADRNSGVILIFLYLVFLGGYAMFFKSFYKSTLTKGLGFGVLGTVLYVALVLSSIYLNE